MNELRYGSWRVLEPCSKDKGGIQLYSCKCDCGTVQNIQRTLLEYNISVECNECKQQREVFTKHKNSV